MTRKTGNTTQSDVILIRKNIVKDRINIYEGRAKSNDNLIGENIVKDRINFYEVLAQNANLTSVNQVTSISVPSKKSLDSSEVSSKCPNPEKKQQNQNEPARTEKIGIGSYSKMSFYKQVEVMARETQSNTPAAIQTSP